MMNSSDERCSDMDNELMDLERLPPTPTSTQGQEEGETEGGHWTRGPGVFEGKFIKNVNAQSVLYKSKDAGWKGKTVVIMWDKIMMERMSKGSFKEMTLGLIYKWTEMAEVTGYVQTLGKIEFSKQKQARDNMSS